MTQSLFEVPSIPRPWWRVEVDATGAILSCKEVEAEGTKHKRVLYCQAANAAEAVEYAAVWYKAYRIRDTARSRARQAALSAANLCTCCGQNPIKAGFKIIRGHQRPYVHCERCHQRRKVRKQQVAAGAKPLLIPAASPQEALDRRRASTKRGAKKLKAEAVLRGVLEKYDTLPAAEFRAWLTGEILRRQKRALGIRSVAPGIVQVSPKNAIDWFQSTLEKAQAAE